MTSHAEAESREIGAVGARSRWGTLLVGVAVVVFAANLRVGISSVGPLVPHIVHDLGTTLVYASLLTTAPVIVMGLASPVSARMGARFGMERTIVAAAAIIVVATAARVWTSTPLTLLLSAVVLGSGIAAGNTMLPAVVRRYFPGSATLLTGLYAVGLNAGAGLAAYGTPRLARTFMSWHIALASWAALAAVAAALWLVIAVRTPTAEAVRLPRLRASRHTWMAALFYGLQSMVYYGLLAWLAPLYEDRGWSAAQAGLLLGYFTAIQVVGALAASVAVHRTGRLAAGLRLTALASGVGLMLVALTPLSAPWLWVSILALGVGGIFPLTLTIPLAMTSTSDEARTVAASMLFYGYMLGATGPFIVSILRSSFGSYEVAFAALAISCVASMAFARAAVRPRSAKDLAGGD